MNPENPTPREHLEARLTALVLGELPANEAEALRAKIANDGELRALFNRLQQTVELVRETASDPAQQTQAPPAPLKMSEAKRESLLAQFKTVQPKEFEPVKKPVEMWRVALAAAACAAVTGLLAALLLPNLASMRSMSRIGAGENEQEAVVYTASPTPAEHPPQIIGAVVIPTPGLATVAPNPNTAVITNGVLAAAPATPSARVNIVLPAYGDQADAANGRELNLAVPVRTLNPVALNGGGRSLAEANTKTATGYDFHDRYLYNPVDVGLVKTGDAAVAMQDAFDYINGQTRDDVGALRYAAGDNVGGGIGGGGGSGGNTSYDSRHYGSDARAGGAGQANANVAGNKTGDPEWVGILDHPDARHSDSNYFIGRYAYIALPSDGMAVDSFTNRGTMTADTGFMFNQNGSRVNAADAAEFPVDPARRERVEPALANNPVIITSTNGLLSRDNRLYMDLNGAANTGEEFQVRQAQSSQAVVTAGANNWPVPSSGASDLALTHRYSFGEALTDSAGKPVATPSSGDGLVTQKITVNPNTFAWGLAQAQGGAPMNGGGFGGGGGMGGGGGSGAGAPGATQDQVKNFFRAAGVELSDKDGKSVSYNDRTGELTVRGTAQDAALVRQATEAVQQPDPGVKVKAVFGEVRQDEALNAGQRPATNLPYITGTYFGGINGTATASTGEAQSGKSADKTPVLGDVPVLGWAFRTQSPKAQAAQPSAASADSEEMASIKKRNPGYTTLLPGQRAPDSAGPVTTPNPVPGNPAGYFPGTAYNGVVNGVIPSANTLVPPATPLASTNGIVTADGVDALTFVNNGTFGIPAKSDGNLTSGLRNTLNAPSGTSRDYPNATQQGTSQVTYDPETHQLIVVTDDKALGNIGGITQNLDQPKEMASAADFVKAKDPVEVRMNLQNPPAENQRRYEAEQAQRTRTSTAPAAQTQSERGSTSGPMTVAQLNGLKITAMNDAVREQAQLDELKKLPQEKLADTLSRIVPDPVFSSLLKDKEAAETKLAALKVNRASGNADVKQAEKATAELDGKIDARVESIMTAMQTRAEIMKKQAQTEPTGSNGVETAAKNELARLNRLRDVVVLSANQEQVEKAMPKTQMVDVLELASAEPAQKPSLFQSIKGAFTSDSTATARIKVQKDAADRSGIAGDKAQTGYDPYFVQTEFETIQSAAVLDKVVENMKSDRAWAGSRLQPEEARALLKKSLQVSPVRNTSLIDIKVKSDNPEEAAKIANTVAETYRNYRLEQQTALLTNAMGAFDKQLDKLETQIQAQAALVSRLQKEANKQQAAQPVKPKEEDKPAPRKPAGPAPVPQPEVLSRENAFSTFSLNVSDVSFKLAAASLERGEMPDPASIRSEEFINALDYRDPEPPAGARVAFAWERARYPFAQNRDLLRFSIKTAALGRQRGRPLNLVLLLDKSGSMERVDRVRIVQEALRVLSAQLGPQDRVSVVTFARTARLWVDGIAGNTAGEVLDQAGGLTPEGGTNLEDAMNLAYATALRHYLANGVNRVVLLTDGAANLGNVDPESLQQKVETHRKQGIALDCFGIGWEGYNDDLLEVLSRHGDGRYGFINTPEEAADGFAGQLAGALHVAAADVKVQVEFNPKRVTAYRQIGYAKHQLTKEQFRDNTVDAAEIGAAEAGNALYTVEVNPAGEGPLATVRVRYKVPETGDYREQEWTVPCSGSAAALEDCGPTIRLAAASSAFSEWLAQSPFAQEVTPDRLLKYLNGVPEIYGADARPQKLEAMIRQARAISGK